LSHGAELNKIHVITFSDHMQLVRDLICEWDQWYKYSSLNLKEIRTMGYLKIRCLMYRPTFGKEYRLLQVGEVFCVIPIHNRRLHLKIKFTHIIFISCVYGLHHSAFCGLTALLALIICVKQCLNSVTINSQCT
jgi:hypothetical protein